MKLNKSSWITHLFLALFIFIMFSPVSAQNKITSLEKLKVSVDVKNKSFYEILGILASKYKIPIGFETSKTAGTSTCTEPVNLNLSDAGINELLDVLAANCAGYKWEIVDDTVEISPVNQESSLLDIKIENFEAFHWNRDEIEDAIFNLSEVKAAMKKLGAARDSTQPLQVNVRTDQTRYSLTLKNQNLRSILRYIIKNTKFKYWCWNTDNENFIRLTLLNSEHN